MRATRADSALIEECSQHHGVSIRAVQKWRQQDDPRWRAFLQRRAQDATVQMAFTPPALVTVAMTPEIEEQNAAVRYALIDRMATDAAMTGDAAKLPALIKNATDAHRQLDVVRENNLAHKERTEKVIPVEKVRDLIQGNLQMARHLLENLPEVMATRIESPQDVASITRIEVNAILRELAASSSGVSWMNPTPPASDDIATAD